MRRKRFLVVAAVVACSMSALVLAPGVSAAGSTTVNFVAPEHGFYSCVGPCASATYFNFTEVVQTGSNALGTAKLAGAGTVLDYNPVTNCLDQSEQWALTPQNGSVGKDTIFISTTVDTYCFTSDANVSIETATWAVTGGTGRFADASGSGVISETVRTHPQSASGTLSGTITY